MGKLQATSPLFIVWGQPPAQGFFREREPFFNTDIRSCQLAEGETAHPSNYRGGGDVGMQKK
jgi:hypothetical protein